MGKEMECCVCWESMTPWNRASFSSEGHCRPEHALCVPCYTKCDACPLCRYHPRMKPPIHAEMYLDELRQRKQEIIHKMNHKNCSPTLQETYHTILNQMNDIKLIINSISVLTR